MLQDFPYVELPHAFDLSSADFVHDVTNVATTGGKTSLNPNNAKITF
jgi:hypothetical protein